MLINLPRISLTVLLAAALLMCTVLVRAAEIKVMSDSPLEPALTKVVELYRQQTHNPVSLVFDPSPAVKKRLESGESADVVIVQPDFAEALTKSGNASPGDRPVIAHVGVGLGSRIDSPTFDISNPDKLKKVLLDSDLLVFNSVKSGEAFQAVLERLGIAEPLKSKIVRTTPNGIFEPVLKGHGNDVVAGTIPLIATTPGIKLLGPLPGDLQSTLTYTAVVLTNTMQREPAEGFIKFLVSPAAKDSFAANGAK